ncbi:MAG TPA: hypothetical protein P5154_03570 [Candidatus Izemoplasmatales bacterium]|nr:hypothetical protein [Candidatus Izemoplasmatales bacterium]
MNVFPTMDDGADSVSGEVKRFRVVKTIPISQKLADLQLEPTQASQGLTERTLNRLSVGIGDENTRVNIEGTELRLRVPREIVPFLPVFAFLDGYLALHPRAILAIDGPSASGKTTLSRWLSAVYGCETIHMDDYFLPRERAVSERLAESGGNIDHERFVEEVVLPLRKYLPLMIRKFDCATQTLSEPIALTPTRLLVVEGVYALHPKFRSLYDLTIFLDVSPSQKAFRILRRNGLNLKRTWKHLTVWIPLENRYFRTESLRGNTDVYLRT